MHGSLEVSTAAAFRTTDEEIEKLLEECQKLRSTLKEISSQVSRMENRVKRAFPAPAGKVAERQRLKSSRAPDPSGSSLTSEQALAEFDKAVQLASCDPQTAESFLLEKRPDDLVAIARELGIAFGKSKPSMRAVKDAVVGRVRESLLLSRHHTQRSATT